MLSEKNQKNLTLITDRIKSFGPNKIFVEYPYNRQDRLDSLYQEYINGNNQNDRDEIVQIAFRAAKKLGLPRIYAIDYTVQDFPYDSLINEFEKTGQDKLLLSIQAKSKRAQEDFNDRVQNREGVLKLLLYTNDSSFRKNNTSFYLAEILQAGSNDNFVGAYIASEWFKRNLYMYSLIRKPTAPEDSKVFVLLGSGHIAMIHDFMEYDDNFEAVELKGILADDK